MNQRTVKQQGLTSQRGIFDTQMFSQTSGRCSWGFINGLAEATQELQNSIT
jgi:hypothetical protein